MHCLHLPSHEYEYSIPKYVFIDKILLYSTIWYIGLKKPCFRHFFSIGNFELQEKLNVLFCQYFSSFFTPLFSFYYTPKIKKQQYILLLFFILLYQICYLMLNNPSLTYRHSKPAEESHSALTRPFDFA